MIYFITFFDQIFFSVYIYNSAEPTPAGTELQISPRQQPSEPLKSPTTAARTTAAAAAAWLQTPGATAASQERRQWASHGHQRGSVASCGGWCWWRKTTAAAATSEASGIQVVLCPRPYRTADSTAATKSKGEPWYP